MLSTSVQVFAQNGFSLGAADTIFKARPFSSKKQSIFELLGNSNNSMYGDAAKQYAALTSGTTKIGLESEKVLSNVKVLPAQVTDQVSISFRLSKDVNVSVKLMDALGNEVSLLLSQRLNADEHNHVFDVSNKLSKGYYFIRVTAGSEQPIIKRIEVL